jgi:site-specific DNA-methyltransferase (adenine-specific)/adenine-specific DNA-methyltransferase
MPTLDWIGKKAVENHHKEVPYRLLKCVPGLSVGEPGSGNLLVQGDNLEALKALLPYYGGKVKCIYIDPPYNTGDENWVYNDAVNSLEMRQWLGDVVGRDDLSRHDKWLCMMYPRMALLREFLTEDGAIFISIDDNEVAHLHNIMGEIFGETNFLANVVWQKRTSPDARLHLGPAHDFVVAYAKDLVRLKPTLHKVAASDERTRAYRNPDNDPRGAWASVDLTGQTGHATPEQFYEITTPSGTKLKPPSGRCWALAERTFLQLMNDNRIWFGKEGCARPRLKKFLGESEGVTTWTWWPHVEVGHNQEATKEINEVMSSSDVFDNPKPARLIHRILQLASDRDSIILDSFAGSGTTGHAILKLNHQDGGNRRFILIEMDPKIARDITAERVRRVAQGYTNAKGEQVEGLGVGFRFCELGATLFSADGSIRGEVKFADLAHHVFFTEMREPLPKKVNGSTPLLGVANGTAVYLLYNGILKDKDPNGGNVVTMETLKWLPAHDGPKVVYGTACTLGERTLARHGITFRQIPYEVKAS